MKFQERDTFFYVSVFVECFQSSFPVVKFLDFIEFDEFYRPQRSCGKAMFSQASVILFTGVGLSVSQHALSATPPGHTFPLYKHTPPGRNPPVDTPLPSACWVHIPLPSACWDTHPVPMMATAADGMHPT